MTTLCHVCNYDGELAAIACACVSSVGCLENLCWLSWNHRRKAIMAHDSSKNRLSNLIGV